MTVTIENNIHPLRGSQGVDECASWLESYTERGEEERLFDVSEHNHPWTFAAETEVTA